MKILFLQTGGTIDKDYPRTTGGWAFEFGEPAATRLLERLSPSFEFAVKTICQKDSLEIEDADREKMKAAICTSDFSRIVITHGTDTLLQTGRFLTGCCPHKTVVLTGAMRPERFSNSDAPLNLGVAVGAVQTLPPGVYVAMHGLVKMAEEMQRDPDSGSFY